MEFADWTFCQLGWVLGNKSWRYALEVTNTSKQMLLQEFLKYIFISLHSKLKKYDRIIVDGIYWILEGL